MVELFRKSFSTSLSDKEKEELDDVLQDDCLKRHTINYQMKLLYWINFGSLKNISINLLLIS